MKRKAIKIISFSLLCLFSGTLFLHTNSLAGKIVDWRIEISYQKEKQELYETIYEQLEVQNALEMVDEYMEMTLPPIYAKYYETRTAKKERLESISRIQIVFQSSSAGIFFVSVGGLVWTGRKRQNE